MSTLLISGAVFAAAKYAAPVVASVVAYRSLRTTAFTLRVHFVDDCGSLPDSAFDPERAPPHLLDSHQWRVHADFTLGDIVRCAAAVTGNFASTLRLRAADGRVLLERGPECRGFEKPGALVTEEQQDTAAKQQQQKARERALATTLEAAGVMTSARDGNSGGVIIVEHLSVALPSPVEPTPTGRLISVTHALPVFLVRDGDGDAATAVDQKAAAAIGTAAQRRVKIYIRPQDTVADAVLVASALLHVPLRTCFLAVDGAAIRAVSDVKGGDPPRIFDCRAELEAAGMQLQVCDTPPTPRDSGTPTPRSAAA